MTPPNDQLSLVIDRPDGTQVRWADDEPDAPNIPGDLSFGTSIPGGFKGLTCNLLRDLKVVGKEGLFDSVRVLGPGGVTRWDGRLQQMPASTDSGGRVTPQAVGWQAHLDDDATAREIYVDRDLSSWAARPLARQVQLTGAWHQFDGTQIWGSSNGAGVGPALDLRIDSYAWSSAVGRPHIGISYAASGIPIGGMETRWLNPENVDTSWLFLYEFFTGIDNVTYSGTGMSGSGGNPNNTWVPYPAPAGTQRAEITLAFPNYPAGGTGVKYGASFAEVAVYGTHGLPGTRGTSYTGSGQGPNGYLASDVIGDALRRWAPLLRYTTGTNGSIQPTDFPIPHLVFKDATTSTDIVERCNAFHQWDWAVWEDRIFTYQPRGTGRTWRISTADGLNLDLEGDTTDRIYTGVVVTYTDYAGVSRSVGPPGSSAEATDTALVTTDPNNPAVAHGIRRWGVLALSVASDVVAATAIGQAWLQVQALATRRGQAVVSGWITDDAGAMRPVSEVRGGDTLIVTDRPDDPPRRIIETNYVVGPRQNTLTLDSTAASLDAILERIGASLTGQV